MACARPGRRSSAPGPPRSSASRRCRPDAVDVSVAGEWSFAQTLRHLVLATDMWLGKAVLEIEQPFHPLGLRRRHGGRRLRHVGLRHGRAVVRRGARGAGGPRRDGARLPRHRHGRRAGRAPPEPARPRAPGDDPVVPAHDPRGGVGAPPLRRARPRRDRGQRPTPDHYWRASASLPFRCAAPGHLAPLVTAVAALSLAGCGDGDADGLRRAPRPGTGGRQPVRPRHLEQLLRRRGHQVVRRPRPPLAVTASGDDAVDFVDDAKVKLPEGASA